MEKGCGQSSAATSTYPLNTSQNGSKQRSGSRVRPEQKIQAKIVEEMMSIDPVRAKVMLDSWTTFVTSANRERSRPLATLDEYIPARIIDCGEL